MSTNDHSKLINRNEPGQHLAKSINYAGVALNVVLDNIKADVAQRPTTPEVAAEYYNKTEMDAQLLAKAGTDHGQLDNRDAPGQHPASAILYDGDALDTQLDSLRTDIADRPTTAEVAAGYYDKGDIDTQMAAKAGLDPVTATRNGLATPELHTFSAYSDNGWTEMNVSLPCAGAIGLQSDKVVPGRRYLIGFVSPKAFESGDVVYINGKTARVRMADGAVAPDGLFASGVQKMACLDTTDPDDYVLTFDADPRGTDVSGFLDAACSTSGTRHTLAIPNFVAPYPDFFTVRTVMDADYLAGNEFVIGSDIFTARTSANDAAPDRSAVAGAIAEITFDTARGLAFFRKGVGDQTGKPGHGWNISVGGETPVADGIHIPDAVQPSKVYLGSVPKFSTPQVKQVAKGSLHSLILLASGKVLSCGYGGNGQIGRVGGSYFDLGFIPGLEDITAVSVNRHASFFLRSDGRVFSCGTNTYGELGRDVPQGNGGKPNLGMIPDLSNVVAISSGDRHSLFLCADGTVFSTGVNSDGQLGRITAPKSQYCVSTLGSISEIKERTVGIFACGRRSYFLLASNKVWACGSSTNGLLGHAMPSGDESTLNLAHASQLGSITKVSGSYHILFLMKDGTVYSGGDNTYGQLGRTTLNNMDNIAKIPGMNGIVDIATSDYDSFFIKRDGTVLTCGSNEKGVQGRVAGRGSCGSINLGTIPTLKAVSVCSQNNGTIFTATDGTLFFMWRGWKSPVGSGRIL